MLLLFTNITRVETIYLPPPLTITRTSEIVSHGKHNLLVRNPFLSMSILYEYFGFKKKVQVMNPVQKVIGKRTFCKTIFKNISQAINPIKINAEAIILLNMDGLIETYGFRS